VLLSPVHTSNSVEATLSKQLATLLPVALDIDAVLGSNVEATFDFVEATFDYVERTKFQRKTCSTLLLVWTGF